MNLDAVPRLTPPHTHTQTHTVLFAGKVCSLVRLAAGVAQHILLRFPRGPPANATASEAAQYSLAGCPTETSRLCPFVLYLLILDPVR